MKKLDNILWGLLFIALGVIFGLNALDITDINIFFDGWWTLFIIVPCFIGLFKENEKTGNLIGLLIGIFLLLSVQGIVSFEIIFKLLVPAIFVIIGLSFLFKGTINKKVQEKIKSLNKTSLEQYCATFGKQDVDFADEKFDGCEFNAIFGGVKCDLRDSIIKEDAVIKCTSVFGGITIYAPKNVNIKVSSTPIFGGVSNEIKNSKDSEVTIYITATCIFGGVEIK